MYDRRRAFAGAAGGAAGATRFARFTRFPLLTCLVTHFPFASGFALLAPLFTFAFFARLAVHGRLRRPAIRLSGRLAVLRFAFRGFFGAPFRVALSIFGTPFGAALGVRALDWYAAPWRSGAGRSGATSFARWRFGFGRPLAGLARPFGALGPRRGGRLGGRGRLLFGFAGRQGRDDEFRCGLLVGALGRGDRRGGPEQKQRREDGDSERQARGRR